MKKLLAVNLLVLMFAISLADDCGADRFSKAIELYKDFDALHMRACHNLNINVDTYLLMRKRCIKDLVKNFDYEDFGNLAVEFWQSECLINYGQHVCDDQEYVNFKHCAFDFGLEHLDELLELYKNRDMLANLYNYSMEAKECLSRGLTEIETNHRLEEIPV